MMSFLSDNILTQYLSVSGNDLLVENTETDTADGEVQTVVVESSVDIEPLKIELMGVNEKLTVILAVVVCLLVWKCATVMYKFFDMFF